MQTVKDEPKEVRIPPVRQEPTRTRVLSTSNIKLEHGVSRRLARRLVMDCIEVPTLALVEKKRKREQLEESEVKGLAESGKLKIKKLKTLPNIDLATISRRLDVLGPPSERNLDITLPHQAECLAAPRAFFSSTWGGGPVETFPNIGEAKAKEHNYRDFMYPNIEYNPALPLIAGAAGLMFTSNGLDLSRSQLAQDHTKWRVIAKLPQTPAIWLYVGQYIRLQSPPLTQLEWLHQDPKVRSTWAAEIIAKGWGKTVRTRVHLRKQLRKEPTSEEIEEYSGETKVDAEDIRKAFDQGDELLGVWVLKPVGYDEEFQQQNYERFKIWEEIAQDKKKVKDLAKKMKGKTDSKARRPNTVPKSSKIEDVD